MRGREFEAIPKGEAMDRKKALDAWKKAKPMLLLDTGVSDTLRKLPDSLTEILAGAGKSEEPKLKQIVAELDGKLADKKIKAETKAVKCIKDIQKSITDTIKVGQETRRNERKLRSELAQYIGKLCAEAVTFHKASANLKVDKTRASQLNNYMSEIGRKIEMYTLGGYNKTLIPQKVINVYKEARDGINEFSGMMIEIANDSRSAAPKFDTKTDYQKAWTAYGSAVSKMAKVAGVMAALAKA